ncbi:MAG: Mov34/MPN/PAD-1 family protein [Isosphaeraceae bacterium]|nr:Mov34/MPN/PAD-1 family protein [Isosphaeraceae bacterium]
MSHDDIQFDDIRYREPVKARRPDRDPRKACLAYGLPAALDLPIYIDMAAADKIERHALSDTSVELGGILLGKECVDDTNGAPFVWITQALEAKHYESSEARFKYTHESWQEITRERDRLYPDLDIVGWYHTHPDFGIFLSGLDLFIHENYFAQPLQTAYVVDPIRQTRGFFQWRSGRMESSPIGGFHVVADRGDRVALSRFVNELEGIPNSEGGGGGLSPRLEAKLDAMLSRPHTYAPSSAAADRSIWNALALPLGMLLGAAAVAVVLWLNNLALEIQRQAETIGALKLGVEESTNLERVAFDALLDRVAKADPAQAGAGFLDAYKRAVIERDRLRVEAENRDVLLNRVAADTSAAARQTAELERKLADALAESERRGVQLAEARRAKESIEKARDGIQTHAAKIAADPKLLAEIETDGGTGLLKRYQTAWYSAVVGWCSVIALGAGGWFLWSRGSTNAGLEGIAGSPNGERPIVVSVGRPAGPTDEPHRIA